MLRDGDTLRLLDESSEPILEVIEVSLREVREVRCSDVVLVWDDPSARASRMRSNFRFLVSSAYDMSLRKDRSGVDLYGCCCNS